LAPGNGVIQVTSTVNADGTTFYQLQLVNFDIFNGSSAGNLPSTTRFRASPTQTSFGGIASTANPDGTYKLSSYFDIWTDYSNDGGKTWVPANEPFHVILAPAAAEQKFPTSDYPASGSKYASQAEDQRNFGSAIRIKNVRFDGFSSSTTLPALGQP